MVEYHVQLDRIFQALADPTRRDILRRVAKKEQTISQLAKPHDVTFAAIAKQVHVLEQARLVKKRREGKQQIVSLVPETVRIANKHLQRYEALWQARFASLDQLLTSDYATTNRDKRRSK